jgi:hypothetical protein
MLYKRFGMQNCCNSEEKLFAGYTRRDCLFTRVPHSLSERTGNYSEERWEFPDKFLRALRATSCLRVSLAKPAYFAGIRAFAGHFSLI